MTAPVLVFVVVAYTLSIGLSSVIGLTGGHNSPLLVLSFGTMFIPAVAVIVVRIAMNERLSVDWGALPLTYVPLAALLMPSAMHSIMLPLTVVLTSGLPWQGWLADNDNGVFRAPASLGWGTLNAAGLASHLILNAAAGLIIVSILAFFEEIAWRAWLLPRIAQAIGQKRTILIVSIVWALWHIPFVLSGIMYFAHISIGAAALIMPLGEFGAGLVIGWFWWRTKSIWIVSIAHGALNNWGQFAFKFMQDRPIVAFGTQFGSHETPVLAAGGLALAILGGLLVDRCTPSIE